MSGKLRDTSRSDSAAIVATGAAFFMTVLDTLIVNLAFPRIKDVFHADLTALQWLVDGYALVFAILLLNAGALGDRYYAKRMFSAGLLIFSAASAGCGLAPDMASLLCARAIQGIGAAILLPNSLAALNHTVQDPERMKIAVSHCWVRWSEDRPPRQERVGPPWLQLSGWPVRPPLRLESRGSVGLRRRLRANSDEGHLVDDG